MLVGPKRLKTKVYELIDKLVLSRLVEVTGKQLLSEEIYLYPDQLEKIIPDTSFYIEKYVIKKKQMKQIKNYFNLLGMTVLKILNFHIL